MRRNISIFAMYAFELIYTNRYGESTLLKKSAVMETDRTNQHILDINANNLYGTGQTFKLPEKKSMANYF